MSEIAIRVENLGKQYRIGALQRNGARHSYKSLRDSIADAASLPLRAIRSLAHRNGHARPPSSENFSALSDVSFEVKRGEVVGVIGRNGAGKSTLLKILSRITEPTSGRVEIHGRVGSLLEVGTGFHPELTGRDNIYLNGAILGMKRAEIRRQFDEIVAFAEVEKFIDTPVKHYSSGMYLRLAFAVAAHLEPELLIVDEVLAVGDLAFQKKCLRRISEVGCHGGTILLVSHHLQTIETICARTVLLDKGRLRAFGPTRRVLRSYRASEQSCASSWTANDLQFSNPYFTPLRFAVTDADGAEIQMPTRQDLQLWVTVEGQVETATTDVVIGYALYAENGTLVYHSYNVDQDPSRWPKLTIGHNRLRSQLPVRLLNEGTYALELSVSLYRREWICRPGHSAPSVQLAIEGGASQSPYWHGRDGVVAPTIPWVAAPNYNPDFVLWF